MCSLVPGAHLASCLNQDELEWLEVMSEEFWVGYNDLANDGNWVALDGSTVAFKEYDWWTDGNPPTGTIRNCGVMRKGKFVDEPCNAQKEVVCKLGPTACAPPTGT